MSSTALAQDGDLDGVLDDVDNCPSSNALPFALSDFSDVSALRLNGDTAQDGTALALTSGESSQRGSAWLSQAVVWNETMSFATFFEVQMGEGSGGTGVTFILQNDSTGARELSGSELHSGYPGIRDSVGIQFDTNRRTNDPNDNHIAVHSNADVENHLAVAFPEFDMNGNTPFFVWVEYNGLTDLLEVFVSQTPDQPLLPLLSHTIDVAAEVGQRAFIGFGAAGGNRHAINQWAMVVADADQSDGDDDGLGDVCDNCPDTADTVIDDFTDFLGLNTNGDASQTNFLRVSPTRGIGRRHGSVFLSERIELGEDDNLETAFHARIHGGSADSGAHGMTFVIHNDERGADALGDDEGGLGYLGIRNSVAIEFDTDNSNGGDPNGNHVALLTNGSVSDHLAINANPGFDFNNLESAGFFVWVEYEGSTNLLEVFISTTDAQPAEPVLTHTIDIPAIVGGNPFIGFTAASKRDGNHHDILSWRFSRPDQTDTDEDGLGNICDNCLLTPNEDQADGDSDGVGNDCDNCILTPNEDQGDGDNDGLGDACDNCPLTPNEDQADGDSDRIGDVCDNCPEVVNEEQSDGDGDGLGDACDVCPNDPDDDADEDELCGDVDNCPNVANGDQSDVDDDGVGDACDVCPNDPDDDADEDELCGDIDNCPTEANGDQSDADGDGLGDVCDPDADGDGVGLEDNCPLTPNESQLDTDGDGRGNACDDDDDNDTVPDEEDNCPLAPTAEERVIHNFSAFPGLSTNGNASRTNVLRVAPARFLDPTRGSVFFSEGIELGENDKLETAFRARIHSGSGNAGAHGMTFVIHNDERGADALGGQEGGLGYSGIRNSVAIEFDTDNSNGGDPNGNHVGLLTNGRVGDHVAINADPGIDFNSLGSAGFFVWVEYEGSTDLLEVFISTTDAQPAEPVLTHTIDIPAIVGGTPFFGFTAASSGFGNDHEIVSWRILLADPDQTDTDEDGLGNICDDDDDNDQVSDGEDNCPLAPNEAQADGDSDGVGDDCDNCILTPNEAQADGDNDGIGDACDNCPADANTEQNDGDNDGIGNACDVCLNDPDNDADEDEICGDIDNCPLTPNEDQTDGDSDGTGDVCDNCPDAVNEEQNDGDGDGLGDACDVCPNDPDNDADQDEICGDIDNCPNFAERVVIDDFTDFLGLNTNGDASQTNFLRVSPTRGIGRRHGSAFLSDRIGLGQNDNLETAFHARIHGGSGDSGAHGMTFVIHDDERGADALGDDEGGLGYSGISNSVAVEFDTSNSNGGDPNGNHVALLTDGSVSDHLAITANPGFDFNNLESAGFFVWVEYEGSTNLLEVFISTTDAQPAEPVLTHTIDLPAIVGGNPFIGFTAASKRDGNHHDILSWRISRADPDQSDTDGDGLGNLCDNCPEVVNEEQVDGDGDGLGDACDVCPNDAENDLDEDDVCGDIDNCPTEANGDQGDVDGDGLGDVCDPDADGDGVVFADNCPLTPNEGQLDTDEDGQGNACDEDDDNDTVPDEEDNCPLTPNPEQLDADGDDLGDACDVDDDNDEIEDGEDNCPFIFNEAQLDLDEDGLGDACDDDDDGDGVPDEEDNCPLTPNPEQRDLDEDGLGNVCDNDVDGDAIPDEEDNCPLTSNEGQLDTDEDGLGNACDPDDDNDTVPDQADNCPLTPNPEQLDFDEDGLGDACEGEFDGDGIPDEADNCPLTPNPEQGDLDEDGLGDVCDDDDDGDTIPDDDDNCPLLANGDQVDTDEDGFGNVCDEDDDDDTILDEADNCPLIANEDQIDLDEDGLGDVCDDDDDGDVVRDEEDNCPRLVNEDQLDTDEDGQGNACDDDDDDDTVPDEEDNCPLVANPEQLDFDEDGLGDVCEGEFDGDGIPDEEDNCPLTPNPEQLDTDGDDLGDACDVDDDNDEIEDGEDNCPLIVNELQLDLDEDGLGDACDDDDDGDGIPDEEDNCPLTANPEEGDLDEDGLGDVCDDDDDGDTIPDEEDNCVQVANEDQRDLDDDSLGDACDEDDDNDTVFDEEDNCSQVDNPDQSDLDEDGIGDACDADLDGDGLEDVDDNCPLVANEDQRDTDGDGQGDACDSSDDGDGDTIPDDEDNCPEDANPDQLDSDSDGIGDACDPDVDEGDNGTAPPSVSRPNTGCAQPARTPTVAPPWLLLLLGAFLAVSRRR